jgi:hypothetical protein
LSQAGIHPELPDLSPDAQAAAANSSSSSGGGGPASTTANGTRPNGVPLTASQKAAENRQAVHAAANEAREWRLKASMLEQQLHRMESLHQVGVLALFSLAVLLFYLSLHLLFIYLSIYLSVCLCFVCAPA